MEYIVILDQLLGDGLMCTPGLQKLKEEGHRVIVISAKNRPSTEILINSPCIDELTVTDKIEDLKKKYSRAIGTTIKAGEERIICIPDVHKAYEELLVRSQSRWSPELKRIVTKTPHLSQTIALQMGVKIEPPIKYHITLSEQEIEEGKEYIRGLGNKPVIVCSAVSRSCASVDPADASKPSGLPPNKMLPKAIWEYVIDALKDRYTLLFVKAKTEPRIGFRNSSDITWEESLSIRKLAAVCKSASMVISVDNGIQHLTQAVNGNLIVVSAAMFSTAVAEKITNGKFICVDHSRSSETNRLGIATVHPDEIVDAVNQMESMQ